MTKEKSTRGNASQFFIAGELCRRGYSAVVTLGNTPNTDGPHVDNKHWMLFQVSEKFFQQQIVYLVIKDELDG